MTPIQRTLSNHFRCLTIFSALGACYLSQAWADVFWNNAGSGDWSVGTNWAGGQTPAPADTVWINNGGTANILTNEDITVHSFRMVKGKLTLTKAQLKVNTPGPGWMLSIGDGLSGMPGNFTLELNHSILRGPQISIADTNGNASGQGTTATINMTGNSQLLPGGPEWFVIGRFGGQATVNMYDTAKIVTHGNAGPDRFFGLAESSASSAVVTMRNQSAIETDLPIKIGIGSGAGVLNMFDQSRVATPGTHVSWARSSGSGVLNMQGGTLVTGFIERNPHATAPKLIFNGGTIAALHDEKNFLRVEGGAQVSNFAEIKSGGLTIDTNNHDILISQPLYGSGKLTKTGKGILTFDSTQAFTGGLEITAAKLGDGGVEFREGVALASPVTVKQNGGILMDDEYPGKASIANLTFEPGSAMQFDNMGPWTTDPHLEVTNSLIINYPVGIQPAGFLIPGDYPLLSHPGVPLGGAGLAGLMLFPNIGVTATLVDENDILILRVTGGTPKNYQLEWESMLDDWSNGSGWRGGHTPGEGGRAIINNGGTAVIRNQNLTIGSVKFVNGKLELHNGSLDILATTDNIRIGDFSLNQASDFTLLMTGNSELITHAGGPMLGDRAEMSYPVKATVIMEDNAKMIGTQDWMVIGRWGGHADLTMSGHSLLESIVETNDRFLIIGERTAHGDPAEVTVNLSENATIRARRPIQIAIDGGNATITMRDHSRLESNGYISFGNIKVGEGQVSNAVLNLNGGTLAAAYLMRGLPNSIQLNLNGGTIAAKANEDNFLRLEDPNAFSETYARIHGGGVTIDTRQYNIGFHMGLTGQGGMSKTGSGTLTLHEKQAFSGSTDLEQGTLLMMTGGGLSGPLHARSGTTIAFAGETFDWVETENLSLDDGATLDYRNIDLEDSFGAVYFVRGSLETHGTVHVKVADDLPFGEYVLMDDVGPLLGDGVAAFQLDSLTLEGSFRYENLMLLLTVSPRTATVYDTWAVSAGLSSENFAPHLDPDSDGISNLMEFYLGSNPLQADLDVLPTVETKGNQFTYQFHRSSEAAGFVAQQWVEYTTDLQTWARIPIASSSQNQPVPGVKVEVTDGAPGTQHVQVSLPATGSILLVRLRVK